jgi:phosphatidylserine/phosphatidylglycerophosphate/cardiolipin synthase-like enzyme
MRANARVNGISVQAIAGAQSVLLAMNATEAARRDLLGFAIGRRVGAKRTIRWLNGFKFFKPLVPNPAPGEVRSTLKHPIQSFLWGHYTADPGAVENYVVRPLYRPETGDLADLRAGPDVEVEVRTEPLDRGTHSIVFNRGAVPSQAFARQFGNRPPADETNAEAEDVRWLARGLLQAALDFIGQARGARFKLRAAVYEFTYPPVMRALLAAAASGADVRIVYEAGSETVKGVTRPTSTTVGNEAAIDALPFDRALLIPRRNRGDIPHNKFMVLLENDRPVQVWTGSTNITASGFLGQSNVGHIVRDETVAGAFLAYWDKLAADTALAEMKAWCTTHSPEIPSGPPQPGITPIFSPRQRSAMLEWYGGRIADAVQTVMMTSAFGVTERLATFFDNDRDFLRFLLMERPNAKPETQAMLARDRDTQIAIGPDLNKDAIALKLEGDKLDVWLRERHFRERNGGHVFYIHTKTLMIDVLTDDPLVFSGSANFSPNSLLSNDENMLLIRGDTGVADVYTTEFFRLFNHLYFRYVAQETAKRNRGDGNEIVFLAEDDSWTDASYTPGRYHFRRRELFGVPPA